MENWYILLSQPIHGLQQAFLGRTTDVSIAIDHLDNHYLKTAHTYYWSILRSKPNQYLSEIKNRITCSTYSIEVVPKPAE